MNYQKVLDEVINQVSREGRVPSLLVHSCCAPCSSYVLEYVSQYFEVTIFYYNPNIFPEREYTKRIIEQQDLINKMKFKNPVHFVAGPYEHDKFLAIAEGLELEKEGGRRCEKCYHQRLEETAVMAKAGGYDYFTTTLTISPLKNAVKLNTIGKELGDIHEVSFLPADFKKKNGYKRSLELSKEYNLYRQDFCGCEFSQRERG